MSGPLEVVVMVVAFGVGVPVLRLVAMRLPVRGFRVLAAAFLSVIAGGLFWSAYSSAFGAWRYLSATPGDAIFLGGFFMLCALFFVVFAVAVLVTKGDPWAKYRQNDPGDDT